MVTIEGSGVKNRRTRSISFGAKEFEVVLDNHGWAHHYPAAMIISFTKTFDDAATARSAKIELERALTRLGAGFRWDKIEVTK